MKILKKTFDYNEVLKGINFTFQEGKIESNIYVYINLATLIINYYSILIKMPIFNFCLTTIIICMGFLLFSLLIVYKLAPKTFKIRT